MNLEPTGERMIVEHYSATIEDYVIYVMHVATYKFAEQFVKNKRVLDYGCGSGYGSAQISSLAKHVDAVDVAHDAVVYAKQHYSRNNLNFHCVTPGFSLPFEDGSFDTVLSFQVFEHVENTDQYLAEISRVLVPGGCLLLVTPDRDTRLFPLQRPWNRWHIREYSAHSLSVVLKKHFSLFQIFHMTGRKDVVDVELRRCTRMKWVTLPFTLPIIPDFLRVKLLNLLHAIKGVRKVDKNTSKKFEFNESDIKIAENASPSLNLVAIVRK